jgi:hypothetical protein
LTYDPPETIAGQLQRGLGRGARAVRDPSHVDACLGHSYAWDWQTDSRDVYLARLVRDLALPVEPIVARLNAAEPELGDTEFTVTLGVLGCLGVAGFQGAVDGVRDYIRRGPGWQEALEHVAEQWPSHWDDLRDRVPEGRVFGEPWERWAEDDPGIPLVPRNPSADRRPLAERPTSELLAALRDPARRPHHHSALRELAHRPAEPELLTLDLTRLRGPVGRALEPLGAAAVPAARSWLSGPLRHIALPILAAHGDMSDAPTLLAEIEAHDDHCGYDYLVLGLARIGHPDLAAVLDRLWLTPHSYERTAYLRAYPVEERLIEGLWDCEEDVRLLAAQRVTVTAEVSDRLRYLRDDPMETAEVRSAAAARLAS